MKQKWQNALGNDLLIHSETKFGKNVRLGYGVIIERDCTIGNNTFIGHYSILKPETKIGNDCIIGHHTVLEGKCIIGNRVTVHTHCYITSDMIIEDDVFIGAHTITTNTKRIKHGRNFNLKINGSTIRRAVRIGAGVLLLPDIEIGENSLIGAGSVVTKYIPPREKWFGNPAIYHGDVLEEEIL